MTEKEKLERAYYIFEKGYFTTELIPSNLKDEFESYNISEEQIALWNNQIALKRYNDALSKLNNPNLKDMDVSFEILPHINYYLKKSIISKQNFELMLNMLEAYNKKGIFIKFFDFYDRSRGGFAELLILTDYWRKKVKDSPYYYGDEFAGIIPYLYHMKEYDLYNRLFKMVIDALKINGNEFQEMFRDLISFTDKYNDKDNHKLALEALDYCKKNTVMTEYSKKWII